MKGVPGGPSPSLHRKINGLIAYIYYISITSERIRWVEGPCLLFIRAEELRRADGMVVTFEEMEE